MDVVMVSGYPDDGFARVVGHRFAEMPHTLAWAERFREAGLTPVTYSPVDPVADLRARLRGPVALFATSGHVPTALSALLKDSGAGVRCAVFLYGYMLGADEAAKQWRFANPLAGRSYDDLRWDVPMFIARAGRDQFAGVKESIDAFAAEGLRRGLPLTLINHPNALHAFDLTEDDPMTRDVIRSAIAFLKSLDNSGHLY